VSLLDDFSPQVQFS